MASVHGETDSERFFALITREAQRTGDVGQGIAAAARWIAEHLPVFALNCILISGSELWALRYPEVHDLFLLERAAGGTGGAARHLDHASVRGSVRVRSGDLAAAPAVILATERMDEDPGWRQLPAGRTAARGGGPEVLDRRRSRGAAGAPADAGRPGSPGRRLAGAGARLARFP